MISDRDTKKIRTVAYTANDALENLMFEPVLTEDSIAEKISTVETCIRLIKRFVKEGENEIN